MNKAKPLPNPKDCLHEQIAVHANVFRLTKDDKTKVASDFQAEITIKCIECNMPFRWLGLDAGVSMVGPMMSLDGSTLRAPVIPAFEA